MNEFASLLVWELGRATLLVALAAVLVALVLAAVRSRSPRLHRIAWCAVLLQGWLLVRLPVSVPWYDQEPLSLEGRGTGERENTVAVNDISSTSPSKLFNPRPSPDPSLAREGSFDASLSLDGKPQDEGGTQPLSLPGRGKSEGAAHSLSLDGRGQGEPRLWLFGSPASSAALPCGSWATSASCAAYRPD
jgi:hypothetical protein